MKENKVTFQAGVKGMSYIDRKVRLNGVLVGRVDQLYTDWGNLKGWVFIGNDGYTFEGLALFRIKEGVIKKYAET